LSSDAIWKFSPCQLDKKVLGTFSRFLRLKTKLFAIKFRHFLEVLCLQGLQKNVLGAISRYVSKNEAVIREVQTHLGSFRLASFTENI